MKKLLLLALMLVLTAQVVPSHAIHFYRGPGGGCTPTDGATTDDPGGVSGPSAATVKLLHNTYADSATGLPVVKIALGQSVKWTWNSAHCHSVTFGTAFGSGFHYPTTEPTSPRVVPGFFDYPVLEENPTLSYTHTFDAAGTFQYFCVHHNVIGMQGVVIVE